MLLLFNYYFLIFSYWLKGTQEVSIFIWQDLDLGEYPGLKDSWMDVISSQGSSLLSVDLSGSEVTDLGLIPLKSCTNLQALNFNYCDLISDIGLAHISGMPILIEYSSFSMVKKYPGV